MKVIQPLFLDKLYAELDKGRKNERKLKELLLRLQNLRIFDPACGSGNFLIIAYKELRKLEMEVIDGLNARSDQSEMYYSGIRLSQFHGIEIDDFAHEVATLSLWLAEHQMNMVFKATFGYSEPALPLRDSGNIVCGNALSINWEELCPAIDSNGNSYEVYICGNPPFRGKKEQTKLQKSEIFSIYGTDKGAGIIDYVSCWYMKASNFMNRYRKTESAFVSTNSIIHGEQVTPVWWPLIEKGIVINFAHQTFNWKSHAKGKAAVHVVIAGFSMRESERKEKKLYTYQHINEDPHVITAKNINPYLVRAENIFVYSRSKPLSNTPILKEGITPLDNGLLSFSDQEYRDFINNEPNSKKWFRPWITGHSFINSHKMYCLWLTGISTGELEELPLVKKQVEKVRSYREQSKSSQAFAKTPWQFRENVIPDRYVVIPKTSSMRREYVPMGYVEKGVVSSSCLFLEGDLYHFGILTSSMSMAWMRSVGGRLKSDYRFSAKLVYNTLPWPDVGERQYQHIEELAEEILLIREDYPDKSLSQLYDPKEMPSSLREAHKALDRSVEKLYRDKPFQDETERLEHLFARYEKLIAEEKAKKPAKKTAKGSN